MRIKQLLFIIARGVLIVFFSFIVVLLVIDKLLPLLGLGVSENTRLIALLAAIWSAFAWASGSTMKEIRSIRSSERSGSEQNH